MIFADENSNKFQKTRFWKEKSFENVVTLKGLPFNSSMIFFHIWLFEGQRIVTHDVIQDFMYAFTWKRRHMERAVVHLYVKSFISLNLYMTWEHQIFVLDVMVTDPTWEMAALSVINQLTCAVVKFSVITKIHKYIGLCKGHDFIPMAMEVYIAPRRDMGRFIKDYACIFHDRWSRGRLSLSFCI